MSASVPLGLFDAMGSVYLWIVCLIVTAVHVRYALVIAVFLKHVPQERFLWLLRGCASVCRNVMITGIAQMGPIAPHLNSQARMAAYRVQGTALMVVTSHVYVTK